jgi:hypothetical protein
MSRKDRDTSKGCRILYAVHIPVGGGLQYPLPRMARRPVIGSVDCMARISRTSPRTRKPKLRQRRSEQ